MDPPYSKDPPAAAAPQPTPPAESSAFFSRRALNQFGLFATGAGFMVCSVAITRRAIVRRQLAAMPKYYHATVPSTAALSKTTLAKVLKNPSPTAAAAAGGGRASSTSSVDPRTIIDTGGRKKIPEDWRAEGSMMALEALSLATVNIVAFAVLLAGGLAFAFDISSTDELRERARRKLYGPNADSPDLAADTDREIEEWVAGVFQKIGGGQDQDQTQPQKEDGEGKEARSAASHGIRKSDD